MNISKLKEDVAFPLKYDGILYIWDANGEMILMDAGAGEYNMNRVVERLNLFVEREFKAFFSRGDFKAAAGLVMENRKAFVLIRGWGRFGKMEDGAERQDNVTDFIVSALNARYCDD